MKLNDLLKQPEGRRIQFKENFPQKADLCKTVIAFANDAGGEVFIGIKDSPRKVVGVSEDELKPTNALLLISDDPLKQQLFPYAKIECARFKGTTVDTFIDRKTMDGNLLDQVEQAYDFVLRHINQSAVTEGVYTKTKWQYPIKAIREVIRNAVIHRDYSLIGKDIKVAIYDNMIEITSPGKLSPSVDYNDMEARQSEIRNRVIAPFFKHLGLIDQWGNGLKLIADELKNYHMIELKWFETGLQFQVKFICKQRIRDDYPTDQVTDQVTEQVMLLLSHLNGEMLSSEIRSSINLKHNQTFRKNYLIPALNLELIEMTQPNSPKSPTQKYRLTGKGQQFINKRSDNK